MEHAIQSQEYVSITLFGHRIAFITDAVVVTWIIMAVIMIAVLLLTRKLEMVPTGGQKIAEALVSFVNKLCADNLGHHWRPFAPYMGTVLLYLAFSNVCAIFNLLPSGETMASLTGNNEWLHKALSLHPPTKNFNVTLCLALMSIILVVGAEFRYKGIKGWAQGFYKPTPISGFIKVLDLFTRPLSLCLRLFGNIMGGTIVMALLYSALPIALPIIGAIYFDLFDGLLQAYVFVFLTLIYLSEAVETEEA